jgi:hypothetical protein
MSFQSRYGPKQGNPIDNDFPSSAITAIAYVFNDMRGRGYFVSDQKIIMELNRLGRFTSQDIPPATDKRNFISEISLRLHMLRWDKIYFFIERVYAKFISGYDYEQDYSHTIWEAEEYFTSEINLAMEEENLAYFLEEGEFRRKGHLQTQKVLSKVGAVLDREVLAPVRDLFNKARRFFDQRPNPDPQNCVKEAVCALEACVETLTGEPASKSFEKSIRKLQGVNPENIPPPIGEGMIKLHAYRGSAPGVAHAAPSGRTVELSEAELVLSLVASYITYLSDLYPDDDDIPF